MQPPPAGSALLAGPDEGLLAPLAGPRSGASPLHPGGVASHALFRQAGQAYLLPAARVLGVVGAEHLRPLPGPVAGWAGTLTVRRRDAAASEAAVPVLDAAALLGQGGPPAAVLLLRTTDGPLGLAVEHVDRVDALPAAPTPLGRAAGLAGALATPDGIWLLLDPARLDALRRAAVGVGPDGRALPFAVGWAAAGLAGVAGGSSGPTGGAAGTDPLAAGSDPDRAELSLAIAPAGATDARVGEPVLVLADRAADDGAASLAVPLRAVRGVSRVPSLRPGPPGPPGLAGYGAWGDRVLPAVDPRALGAVAAGAPAAYAVLVALSPTPSAPPNSAPPAVPSSPGLALLVAGVRGIQRLERLQPAAAARTRLVAAVGETRGRRRADRISVGAAGQPPGATGATAVAVLSLSALAATVG